MMMNNIKIDNFLIEDIMWTLKNFIPDIVEFQELPFSEQWAIEKTDKDPIWQAAHAALINAKIGFGDCFSIDTFIRNVETGDFIDDDGSGSWVDFEGNKIGPISCDAEWLKQNKPENAKFIMWYNK